MLSVAAINLHVCLYCYLNHSEQVTSKKKQQQQQIFNFLSYKI